ncbi:hypothetical protein HK100_009269 [Physocladia obscura]|uniref:Bystin n=1 Tax=Physocladia obscura TaxID=109957 RepID=A0AAD5XA94_9FUNG|nr:hypothetical protein HK100_009269 [Physocladia obscura]
MGKASNTNKKPPRHNPLHVDIITDSPYAHTLAASTALDASDPLLKKQLLKGKNGKQTQKQDNSNVKNIHDDNDDGPIPSASLLVDSKTSQKILEIARQQQLEEKQHDIEQHTNNSTKKPTKSNSKLAATVKAQFKFSNASTKRGDSDDDDDDDEEAKALGADFDNDNYEADLNIDVADAALIEKFMNPAPKKQLNLADLIMEKLDEAANQQTTAAAATPLDPTAEKLRLDNEYKDSSSLDPKIIEVYTKVGTILSRYRSGKLPKAFKIIPALPNWEQVLYLTNPDAWSPHATYQATRIFVSNLQARMAQRFFNLFLLDRVRDDIAETKKLNYHLYLALKKSLYKPAAFFKGFLLPLCESGTCTLREAAIIGSVITKVSIPILDSAAAILKIAEMEYTGPNSLFIRILLDKKYALPYKVLDALVFHFLRFSPSTPAAARLPAESLPVLWHQSLLVFAQRYKGELVPEQKEALLELIRVRSHPLITPEIRREIVESKCRGEVLDIDMMEA